MKSNFGCLVTIAVGCMAWSDGGDSATTSPASGHTDHHAHFWDIKPQEHEPELVCVGCCVTEVVFTFDEMSARPPTNELFPVTDGIDPLPDVLQPSCTSKCKERQSMTTSDCGSRGTSGACSLASTDPLPSGNSKSASQPATSSNGSPSTGASSSTADSESSSLPPSATSMSSSSSESTTTSGATSSDAESSTTLASSSASTDAGTSSTSTGNTLNPNVDTSTTSASDSRSSTEVSSTESTSVPTPPVPTAEPSTDSSTEDSSTSTSSEVSSATSTEPSSSSSSSSETTSPPTTAPTSSTTTAASTTSSSKPPCPTCDGNANNNKCDTTTSCIVLDGVFRCACRAGYKAGDPAKEYRIPNPQFGFLVFVPESTLCNELCKYQIGAPEGLCAEVTSADDKCDTSK